MKKSILTLVLGLLVSLSAYGQISRLGLEVRGDWQYDSVESLPSRSGHSSFEGKFANFRMDGALADNLTYSFRYRINKVQSNPFASTDWFTLNYATEKWDFSAGKQVVAIGGYEYDRAPIDIYFASEYWHQIACYQFGVSATYKFGDKFGSKLLGQICQSPYDFGGEGLYAYNLMYMNSYNGFATLSSVNMLEYAPGQYIGYVAVGLRESYGDVTVEMDVMERFDFANKASSISAMLDVNWAVNEKLNLFGHGSYDVNGANVMLDPTVLPGTDIWRVGGGVEYFPTESRNVRFHAASSYVFGNQGNTYGALFDGDFMFQMGITWRINLM